MEKSQAVSGVSEKIFKNLGVQLIPQKGANLNKRKMIQEKKRKKFPHWFRKQIWECSATKNFSTNPPEGGIYIHSLQIKSLGRKKSLKEGGETRWLFTTFLVRINRKTQTISLGGAD